MLADIQKTAQPRHALSFIADNPIFILNGIRKSFVQFALDLFLAGIHKDHDRLRCITIQKIVHDLRRAAVPIQDHGVTVDLKLALPMKFTQKQIDEWINYLSQNLYNTMTAVVLMTLHDEFDFGKVRIKRFKERFDEKAKLATTFNYMGKNHATLGDYVQYLNEKFDYLELDLERVTECQDNYSLQQLLIGKADIKEVIELLKRHKEYSAADLLEEWSKE